MKTALMVAGLAASVLVVLAPALGNDFLVYDDDLYVTGNPHVRAGLTSSGLFWAVTTGHAANWHPLTWLSHMADVSAWGTSPRGHHLTSVLLHAANTALLFLALRSLTGAFWKSALVAALFGIHPTRIESVAWVAERKDVLSTFFGVLTLLAYAAWARRPTTARYASALAAFAAGLLAKPMLVTLPFVLVLLDVWPLRRVGAQRTGGADPARDTSLLRLLAEKWPFFLLAAASSVVTVLVQRAGGAVGSLENYPMGVRLANALVAYAGYLRRLVWPMDLAVFYPHPGRSLPASAVLGAALLFVGLSIMAFRARRGRPCLFLGWFWFAGMLLPVVGLVQVGFQAQADRYTYMPYVGLFLALVWLAGEGGGRWRAALGAVLATSLVACAVRTRVELGHWRDSETLFRRALAVTRDNYVAHQNLAHHLNETGRPAEAIPHLEEALRIRPRYAEARVNLGRSLFLLGRVDEAVPQFEQAIALHPDDPVAFNNLAFSRMSQGDLAEAVRLYRRALALQPDWAEVQHRAGIVQVMEGDWAGGGERLERAARLEPSHPDYAVHAQGFEARRRDPGASSDEARCLRDYLVVSHRQAAGVLGRRGRISEALDQLRKALRLDPARADIHDEVGVALTQLGRGDEAAGAFAAALRLDPTLATAHNNLGFLLFQKGQRAAAIGHYRAALRLAPGFELARNNLALAEGLRRDGRAAPGSVTSR